VAADRWAGDDRGDGEEAFPGLVPSPARLPDGRRWQLETVHDRGHVFTVAWAPGGQTLACAGDSGQVRLYEVGDRGLRLVRLLLGHRHRVNSLTWGRSGRLASGGDDGTIRVWEVDGRLRPLRGALVLKGHDSPVRCLAWHPDGRRLASGGDDRTVRLWDRGEGKSSVLYRDPDSRVSQVEWSGDGRFLAAGFQQTVRVWRADGRLARTFDQGHTLWALAWTPDGLLATSGADLRVKLWRVARPTPLRSLEISARCLAWHPGGRQLLAVAEEATSASLWGSDGKLKRKDIGAGPDHLFCAAWAADGKRLALGGHTGLVLVHGPGGTVRCKGLAADPAGGALTWSADGKQLLTGKPLALWASDGTRVRKLGPEAASDDVSWSGDGKWIGFLDRAAGLARLCSPEGQLGPSFRAGAAPRFSPDSQRLVLLDPEYREFQVWDVAGSAGPRLPAGKRGALTSGIAWAPGEHVAFTQRGTAGLWEVDHPGKERRLFEVAFESVGAPAWSPDGRWLAIANHTRILLHRGDGTPQLRWEAHKGQIHCLTWAPDSRWLASCGADRMVRLWQTNGTPGPVISGLPADPWRLAWGRDGQLAILGGDSLLAVWKVDERCRALWSGLPLAGRAVTFGPDGQLLSGDEELLEEHFVYVVETERGGQEVLRPSRFGRDVRAVQR
jgi:WD40 repeat protein